MGRYRRPWLVRPRLRRPALLVVGPEVRLGTEIATALRFGREAAGRAPLLVLLRPTGSGLDDTTRMIRCGAEPGVLRTALGTADADELAASWKVSHLITVGPSGVLSERPVSAGSRRGRPT